MSDDQFKAFMALMMVSDPWPLSQTEHDDLLEIADEESRRRGFDNWIDAYHRMP